MHFVLVSFYAVQNIGDRILTDCVRKLLSKRGISSQILDIQGRCAFSNTDTKEERELKIKLSEKNTSTTGFSVYLDRILCDCSLVLFAGGAILDVVQDSIAKNIFLICNKAYKLGIPVAFNAVGFYGNISDNDRSNYLRQALLLPNVKWISVRERANDMEKLLDGRKEFTQCCDPAVWAGDLFNISHIDVSNNIVGINVVSPAYFKGKSMISIEAFYSDLYMRLTESGFQCIFFTNGTPQDYLFANDLIQKFHLPNDILVEFNSFDCHSFLDQLSKYSLTISSRLHTSICSYSLRIPSLCFAWDIKMNEFYEQIGKPEWLIEQSEVSSITHKVNCALHERIEGLQFNRYRNTVLINLDSICKIGRRKALDLS